MIASGSGKGVKAPLLNKRGRKCKKRAYDRQRVNLQQHKKGYQVIYLTKEGYDPGEQTSDQGRRANNEQNETQGNIGSGTGS